MSIHIKKNGLIDSHRDSAFGELRSGDRLIVRPPHQKGAKVELASYEFELIGFNQTTPEVAQASLSLDGRPVAGSRRIDFEALEERDCDPTVYLTKDHRYGALPIYLERVGSDYTEVV